MQILAISFDFSWFLTIPGMLITGGVLLLLIALIIFIATSGKGKKKSDAIETKNVESPIVEGTKEMTPPITNESVASVPLEMNQPLVSEPTPIVNEQTMAPIPDMSPNIGVMEPNPPLMNEVPEPAPIPTVPLEKVEEVNVNPVPTAVEPTIPVVEQPVQPIINTPEEIIPSVSVPPVEPSIASIEQMPPIETPSVNELVLDTPVSNQEIQTPRVSIYGGVSPITEEVISPVEEPHQIYGGANPLDATQSIPVVEQPKHVEYGVPVEVPKVEEVKVVEPAINMATSPVPPAFQREPVEPFMREPVVNPTPESVVAPPSVEGSSAPLENEEEIEVLDF